MKNKLSPLEELRLKKIELSHECQMAEMQLLRKLNYAKGNFGHLLMNSVFSSAKGGVSSMLNLFLPGGSKIKTEGKSGATMLGVGSLLAASMPFIWDIAQPMLIGFVAKKIKSLFTRKKKK